MNNRLLRASVFCAALGTLSLFLAQGCNGKGASQGENPGAQAAQTNEVYEFPRQEASGTVAAGGHTFDYTLMREAATDQAPVHNEMSGDTRDNTITLTLLREGEQIFHHTFTKATFQDETPEDIYPAAVLQEAGVMPEQTGGEPRFWFSLGEPNADLVTFVVAVSPAGTFTYQPDVIDYVPEEGE